MKLRSIAVALLSTLLLAAAAHAVAPDPLFTDNMVLQQGMNVPVWGTAADGEKITVEFAGQKLSATAANGKWLVKLAPLQASAEPRDLKIGNTILHNVLVGEVWLCSGQSNMERQLGPRPPQPLIKDWQKEVADANHPQIRCFTVTPDKTAPRINGHWDVCSPATVANFTAVGYFFARDLHQARNVPVGIIHSSVGGTSALLWTSPQAQHAIPELAESLKKDVARYEADLAKYNAALEAAKKNNTPLPAKLQAPRDPLKSLRLGDLYAKRIVPLQPYALRGVIWYQGESDNGRTKAYRALFPAMIADWRKAWNQGDFPFLFVQIAPHKGMSPEIREAQLLTLARSPNTAMAVITDCGEPNDIHPPHKQPVGARLALAARALACGETIEYSGPLYQSMKIDGNRAILSFSHVGAGLLAKDGALKGFTIAGADKKFLPAQARIVDNTIIVSSDQVPAPAAVRFGWDNVPDVNLFNQEGLPASPFRTDVD